MRHDTLFLGVREPKVAGHHLYVYVPGELYDCRPASHRDRQVLPFRFEAFDGLFWRLRDQSAAVRITVPGWTIFTMADRSGDPRPGSTATFFFPFAGASLSTISAYFPDIATRIETAGPIRELEAFPE